MVDFKFDTGYEKGCSSVRTRRQQQRHENRQHLECCQFLYAQCQGTAGSIAENLSSVANEKKMKKIKKINILNGKPLQWQSKLTARFRTSLIKTTEKHYSIKLYRFQQSPSSDLMPGIGNTFPIFAVDVSTRSFLVDLNKTTTKKKL